MDAERDRQQDEGADEAGARRPAPAPAAEDQEADRAEVGSAAAAQPRAGGDLTP